MVKDLWWQCRTGVSAGLMVAVPAMKVTQHSPPEPASLRHGHVPAARPAPSLPVATVTAAGAVISQMASGRPLDCLYGTGTTPGVAEPLGCEAGAGTVGSRPRGELRSCRGWLQAVGGEGWRGAGSSSPSHRARWHEGFRGLTAVQSFISVPSFVLVAELAKKACFADLSSCMRT